jgi:glycosyltransferase involved in cell wall biosynthesis
VPAAHRDGLLRLAHAMVFPSEYEGFGAPVVEAMSLDTPVIAADQPAVSEVLGNAGLVLPRDSEAWADALDVVAEQRAELIDAGRRRVTEFTAAKSGGALAEAYRLALS